jgi:hypothetical protein
MVEPPQLLSAREHLALAEARYRSEDGLFHLEEGLALLEEVMAGSSSGYRAVAQNLAATYSMKIYNLVRNAVARDRALPEPDLEHLFRVVLAFDDRGLDLPADIRSIKIELVRRLIDHYYEGHSPAEKQAALQQLLQITGEPP